MRKTLLVIAVVAGLAVPGLVCGSSSVKGGDVFPVVPPGGFALKAKMKDGSANPNGDGWQVFQPDSQAVRIRSQRQPSRRKVVRRQLSVVEKDNQYKAKELKKQTKKMIKKLQKQIRWLNRQRELSVSERARKLSLQNQINDLQLVMAGADPSKVVADRHDERSAQRSRDDEERRRQQQQQQQQQEQEQDNATPNIIMGEWDDKGNHYTSAGGGNTWRSDGTFMQKSGRGYINTKTGQYIPAN